jgi:hypothetical protein
VVVDYSVFFRLDTPLVASLSSVSENGAVMSVSYKHKRCQKRLKTYTH